MLIYKVTNKLNNKIYIGQTKVSLNRRYIQHKHNTKKSNNVYFYNAIRKYGIDNFLWEELYKVDNIDELNYLETYLIKYYSSNNNEFGYNSNEGGNSKVGFKHSVESKLKMSETKKGKCYWSDEVKKNMSEIRKGVSVGVGISRNNGKKRTEESKQKQSESRKGIEPWNKGIPCSEESKQKQINTKRENRLKKNNM